MSDLDIDDLCSRFANLLLLWDGAFSYATKIDPTLEDIAMYDRYCSAATRSHIAIGCNVTPKVHLMYRHVAIQMERIPGVLGQKREDWVEQLHQITSRKRQQFRTTINKEVRAQAMENSLQQETHPQAVAYEKEALKASERGPRKGHVKLLEQRRSKRMVMRLDALVEWEVKAAGLKKEDVSIVGLVKKDEYKNKIKKF